MFMSCMLKAMHDGKPIMPCPTAGELGCDHAGGAARLDERLPSAIALDDAAALFRALGDPERLRLLCRLALAEACVSELAAESDQGLSTVSQRLKQLRAERLVSRRREGKHVYYAAFDHCVVDIVRRALDHIGEDDSTWAPRAPTTTPTTTTSSASQAATAGTE
ncbi:MAG: metalloregulator ArsR/SmtB family transcription factor [Myxococcota bacterium]